MAESYDILDSIADEMLARIEAADLDRTFEAAIDYLPDLQAIEADTLHVYVVPVGIDQEAAAVTRSVVANNYLVQVGVAQRVDAALRAEIRDLIQFTRRIVQLFEDDRILPTSHAGWLRTAHTPVYDPQVLHADNIFLSAPVFTFMGDR